MKPRNAGYGAPYPPTSARETGGFKQRVPDKKILEHDRMRAIEVKVLEERERLEEENERIEEEQAKAKKGKSKGKVKEGEKEEGETEAEEGERVLSEEEIDERCEVLRKKLLALDEAGSGSGSGGGNGGAGGKGRRNLKSYQVHELAEAKIEESERLRRALGIKEDGETGEISSWEKRR